MANNQLIPVPSVALSSITGGKTDEDSWRKHSFEV